MMIDVDNFVPHKPTDRQCYPLSSCLSQKRLEFVFIKPGNKGAGLCHSDLYASDLSMYRSYLSWNQSAMRLILSSDGHYYVKLHLRWMSVLGNCQSWTRWILRRRSDSWGNYPPRPLTSSDVAAMSSPLVLLLHHFDIRLFVVILPFPVSLNILIILSGKS